MVRTILLSVAENERERAEAWVRDAASSAIERGVYIGARVPLGYRRCADRRLDVDLDAAPVVLGLYRRWADGCSWARLARSAGEQGHRVDRQRRLLARPQPRSQFRLARPTSARGAGSQCRDVVRYPFEPFTSSSSIVRMVLPVREVSPS